MIDGPEDTGQAQGNRRRPPRPRLAQGDRRSDGLLRGGPSAGSPAFTLADNNGGPSDGDGNIWPCNRRTETSPADIANGLKAAGRGAVVVQAEEDQRRRLARKLGDEPLQPFIHPRGLAMRRPAVGW